MNQRPAITWAGVRGRLRGEPARIYLLAGGLVAVMCGWIIVTQAIFPPGESRTLGVALQLAPVVLLGLLGAMVGDRFGRDRRRALNAAASSEALLRTSLDTVLDPFTICQAVRDSDGNIVDFRIEFANLAACTWAGLPRDEVVEASILQVWPALAKNGLFKAQREVVETREPLLRTAFRFSDRVANGNSVDGTFDLQVLAYGDGYVSMWRDVTHLRAMEADLALAGEMRRALGVALQAVPPDATLEQAAQTICDELARLPGVDFAAVGAFPGSDDAVLVASRAAADFPLRTGDRLDRHRAARLFGTAADGPRAEYWVSGPEDEEWGQQLDAAGLKAFAFGPIVHAGHVDGGIVIGTRSAAFAQTLVDKIATVLDFSTTPSALLAERLHAHLLSAEMRRSIGQVLGTSAFQVVYQPIVELASGEVVGYEALTRFDSGEPPDSMFVHARLVGLDVELELATLERAVAGARALPPGRWLDLNVSPRLVMDSGALQTVLSATDRPIVLEITEHEAIEDYAAVRDAIRGLGGDVRLAVDDAGSGIANFGHLVELGADFVKLDVSLVRRVNTSLGRQAAVVAMRHFARTAGFRLVAEGVESPDEARTLTELGVEYAQGYWFGRPEAAPPP